MKDGPARGCEKGNNGRDWRLIDGAVPITSGRSSAMDELK
jgi:hypothetical protein